MSIDVLNRSMAYIQHEPTCFWWELLLEIEKYDNYTGFEFLDIIMNVLQMLIFVLHLAWCLSNAFSDSIVYTSPTIHYDDHGDSDDDGWCINV